MITTIREAAIEEMKDGKIDFESIRDFDDINLSDAGKAMRALSRILNYCEEIDNNIPDDEKSGYCMMDDYHRISRYLWLQENISDRSLIYSIDEVKGKIHDQMNELMRLYTVNKLLDNDEYKEYRCKCDNVQKELELIPQDVKDLYNYNSKG